MLVTHRGLGRSLGRLGLDPKYANPASASNAYTTDPNRADPTRFTSELEQSWDDNTSDFLLARWQFYKAGLDARINSTIASIRDMRQVTTKYPWRSFVGCKKQAQWGWEDILTPPGVINIYGVPFSLEELTSNGKLERTFVPTKEQRFLIDWAIYTKSQMIVAALIDGKGCGKNVDLYMDHSWGIPNHPQPTELPMKVWRTGKNHSSVRDLMHACDEEDLVTYLPGYSLNPIQPTAEELDGKDGAMHWYLRGGYFLSKRVATGKKKLDSTAQLGLRWSVGYYLCPDTSSGYYARGAEDYKPGADSQPTTDFTGDFAAGGVPAAALYYHTAEGKGWDINVTLEHLLRDMATPLYTLRVTPTDVGAGQKILQGMAKIAEMMRALICTLAPVAAPITGQQLLKETCIDSFGKSCSKGTQGCVCTQPSATQKDAVAISQSLVTAVCAMGQEQPDTTPLPQTLPPPGPVDPQPWRPPWWMIALGGLGAGAFLFSRR